MSSLALNALPSTLQSVRTRPLFAMQLKVNMLEVGEAPGGHRRIGVVTGGTFHGERLAGEVLDGGSDWLTVRPDGVTTLDVRLVMKTTDGAMIGMTYRGLRHGPADVMQKLNRGEAVDPADYYFRIAPLLETAAKTYDWLNRVVCVGVGHRPPGGPVYSVFEVL